LCLYMVMMDFVCLFFLLEKIWPWTEFRETLAQIWTKDVYFDGHY
jgi:hypothetical protein